VADASRIPTKPAPTTIKVYVESDLIDFTPELRAEAIAIARQYRLGPLVHAAVEIKEGGTRALGTIPAGTGASLWQGGGFDPETKHFLHPLKTGPGIIPVRKDPKSDFDSRADRGPNLSVKGLPILKRPTAGSRRSISTW